MGSDSKDKFGQAGNESRVVEFFKLLDAWDRAQGRAISGKDGAGERDGLFVCEAETEQ